MNFSISEYKKTIGHTNEILMIGLFLEIISIVLFIVAGDHNSVILITILSLLLVLGLVCISIATERILIITSELFRRQNDILNEVRTVRRVQNDKN